MRTKAKKKRQLLEYIKVGWCVAVKQGTITMPYKMTNANKALDILSVTLPLNKHSNKRVSQQRVVVCQT